MSHVAYWVIRNSYLYYIGIFPLVQNYFLAIVLSAYYVRVYVGKYIF